MLSCSPLCPQSSFKSLSEETFKGVCLWICQISLQWVPTLKSFVRVILQMPNWIEIQKRHIVYFFKLSQMTQGL